MPSQSLLASETYRLSAGQFCTVLNSCIFVSSKECVQLLDECGRGGIDIFLSTYTEICTGTEKYLSQFIFYANTEINIQQFKILKSVFYTAEY